MDAGDMLYLDTSALLKLYLLEEGSGWVQRQVMEQDDPLPVWELQEAELTNALMLKVYWGDLSKEQAAEQLAHFSSRKERGQYVFPHLDRASMMAAFRMLSEHSRDLGTRTLDVLHVACAVEINPECFLSFDLRQLRLAERAGLNTLIPEGLHP
jgi:predicted nucleic acid-binding protein